MTKNLIKSIAITMVFIPVVTFASPAPSTAPVSSPASSPQASAPSTGGSVSTASSNPSSGDSSSTGAPATGNSSATVNNTPTGGSGSTTGPATGGSSSTGGNPTSTPTPTPTPAVPNNGGGSSSGGSSSSSGSRVAYGYACNQITSYMKYGVDNDKTQVTKLQTFLRDAEKINITVNGIFDKQTENAVIAFQNKYSGTIMGPWGASKGTGYVYITTIKQINKIACNYPLTLNPQELATINEIRNRRNSASIIVSPTEKPSTIQIESKNEDNTITFTTEEETNKENTASVTKSSVMNRFWNFLVYLFK